jgi:hypothetical protein
MLYNVASAKSFPAARLWFVPTKRYPAPIYGCDKAIVATVLDVLYPFLYILKEVIWLFPKKCLEHALAPMPPLLYMMPLRTHFIPFCTGSIRGLYIFTNNWPVFTKI